jgi:hypothetical protein
MPLFGFPVSQMGNDGPDTIRHHDAAAYVEDMLVKRFRTLTSAEIFWIFCNVPEHDSLIWRLTDTYGLAEVSQIAKSASEL